MYFRQLMTSLILPVAFLVAPGEAVAQTEAPKPIGIAESVAAARFAPGVLTPDGSAGKPFTRLQSAPSGGSRDSLKNGAVIGAIVGAVALGGLGAAVCNSFREPTDPGCLGSTLRIAAVGAAIGLGAGVAVDAALTHNAGARVAVRIRF